MWHCKHFPHDIVDTKLINREAKYIPKFEDTKGWVKAFSNLPNFLHVIQKCLLPLGLMNICTNNGLPDNSAKTNSAKPTRPDLFYVFFWPSRPKYCKIFRSTRPSSKLVCTKNWTTRPNKKILCITFVS